MLRIVLFLVLIALAAWGASWIADQPGDVTLSWGAYKIVTTIPVFALLLGVAVVAAILLGSIVTMLLRAPGRIQRGQRDRRHARGRRAITHGLLAIGHGDASAARQHAATAHRLAGN